MWVAVASWYTFNLYRGEGLHGNGTTINDIRNELDQVKENQFRTKERYVEIEKSVNDGIRTVNTMSDRFTEADRIIEQCESIIADIRKTGKEQN